MSIKFLMTFVSIISFSFFGNGQSSKDVTNTLWSFSISYAPKCEIKTQLNQYPKEILTSVDYAIDYRFKNRLSITSGLNFNKFQDYIIGFSYDGLYPGETHDLIKISRTELPVQINYHLVKNAKNIDPYFKASIRNVFYHYSLERQSLKDTYSESNKAHLIYLDMGLGSYIKINKDLSFRFQSSIGLVQKYEVKLYIEGLVGVRYTFIKDLQHDD